MTKIGVTAGCLRALLAGDVLTHEVSKADVASKGLAHFCNCAERAHKAGGISLRELNNAGFALQCAHVSNIQGSGAPASKSDIEWYNTHHGRAAHALCSGATCPSGLRPLSIPNGGGAHKVNRDTMLNWTQRVKEYLNDPVRPLPDDAIVNINDVPFIVGIDDRSGGAAIIGTDNGGGYNRKSDGSPGHSRKHDGAVGAPRSSDRLPKLWKEYVAAKESVTRGIATMHDLLHRAEVPQNDVCDALAAWALSAPLEAIEGVNPGVFDGTIVREGVMVRPADNELGKALVTRLKVTRKPAIDPAVGVKVVKRNDDGTFVIAIMETLHMTVAPGSIERVPPPEPVKALAAWKPRVGEAALYVPTGVQGSTPIEVFIEGVNGEKFIVLFAMEDGEEIRLNDVLPTELSEVPSEA